METTYVGEGYLAHIGCAMELDIAEEFSEKNGLNGIGVGGKNHPGFPLAIKRNETTTKP